MQINGTYYSIRQTRVISRACQLLVVLMALSGCDSSGSIADVNIEPAPLEPLSDVPFSDLGSGALVFERIANAGYLEGTYVIDLDSGENWGFSGMKHSTQISPDGTQLAYITLTPYDPDNNTFWDPYTCDLRGENAGIVIKLPGNHGPVSWSANGQQLIFPGFINVEKLTIGLRWVNVSSGRIERIFQNPGGVNNPTECAGVSSFYSVSESSDGRIAAIGQVACGVSLSILLVNQDDTFEELLGAEEFISRPYNPSWSHDGSALAFLDLSEAETNVRVVNEDGTGLRTIVSLERYTPVNWSGENNDSLAWSPDDSRIAFTHSDAPDQQHIYVVRLNDGEVFQVTHTEGAHDRSISWGL